MSNLGWYQLLTILAKKLGGPKNLIAVIGSTGLVIGSVGTLAAVKIKDRLNKTQIKNKEKELFSTEYIVLNDGVSNEGLRFCTGDRFRILQKDGDAVQIELIGNDDNPYFVSDKFLSSISNYSYDKK